MFGWLSQTNWESRIHAARSESQNSFVLRREETEEIVFRCCHGSFVNWRRVSRCCCLLALSVFELVRCPCVRHRSQKSQKMGICIVRSRLTELSRESPTNEWRRKDLLLLLLLSSKIGDRCWPWFMIDADIDDTLCCWLSVWLSADWQTSSFFGCFLFSAAVDEENREPSSCATATATARLLLAGCLSDGFAEPMLFRAVLCTFL